jgi:hypothetical protein
MTGGPPCGRPTPGASTATGAAAGAASVLSLAEDCAPGTLNVPCLQRHREAHAAVRSSHGIDKLARWPGDEDVR